MTATVPPGRRRADGPEGDSMKRHGVAVFLMAILLAASVAGCGGGGAELKSEVRTTTVGQELTDLKKALDSGVISEKEYETQRKRILERK